MKEIRLTKGQIALVDDADYDFLNQWKWCALKLKKVYYATRAEGPKRKRIFILMHRQIMNTPSGLQVDHIDHNGVNNQRSNLRNCTIQQNRANRTSFGSSQYLGVSVYKEHGVKRIKAGIQKDGRSVHIGLFKTEEDAAKAYDEKAREMHGEYANLNFK